MKPSELLDSPEKWIRGMTRADKDGFWTPPNDGDCKWCAVGAMEKAFWPEAWSSPQMQGRVSAVQSAIKNLFPNRIHSERVIVSEFNDHPETTFEDVRRVLLEAGL